ncbi:MAG: S8 family serine peptidase, partial [Candidatus Methanoperedens sp.]|nr:S8 family serine peptidase [Candidatus Methanoperedens sp.]
MKQVVFELNGTDTSYLKSLKENGASIEAVYENLVQASVPVSQLQVMSGLPFVNYVRSPVKPFTHAVVSEGVGVINATPLHNLGIRGQGVKIAVLDVGFGGYQSKLGSELPSNVNVTVKSFRKTGGGEKHGTAVAEIIYDIAPDAELYLINFGNELEFLKAVDYAISRNVDIISMSVGWLDGPFDGSSTISAKVDSAVDSGIVWVNSAGNYAQKHWEGKFNDPDNNGIHNFTESSENMSINFKGDMSMAIFLSWDDWPYSDQDYDLYVYDSRGIVIAYSTNFQSGTQPPTERISINPENGIYNLQIHKYNSDRDVTFQLYSAYHDLEPQYQVPIRSLTVPADARGAITVGATHWSDDVLEPFSSRGPTTDGRIKPDVVAPDGVKTSTLSHFYGTSASAPHVAGAAALLKNINPSLTPPELRSALKSTAKYLGDDTRSFGSGRIDTWEAAKSVDKKPPAITITSPSNGDIFNNPAITVTGTA